MMLLRYVVTVVSIILISSSSMAATVTTNNLWLEHKYLVYEILISGEIDKNTPEQVAMSLKVIKNNLDALKKTPNFGGSAISLNLNSGGGDVESAIAIGKIARQNEMNTVVNANALCASACTLLYLGGVNRMMLGRFGIHRPYSNHYNISDTTAKESYESVNKTTEKYLKQMNITPRLLEAMNVIPPSDIRWLNTAERIEFGIDGKDPIYSDREASKYARKIGITKEELYSRQRRIGNECSPNENMSHCADDIYNGRR